VTRNVAITRNTILVYVRHCWFPQTQIEINNAFKPLDQAESDRIDEILHVLVEQGALIRWWHELRQTHVFTFPDNPHAPFNAMHDQTHITSPQLLAISEPCTCRGTIS
jgi:hypothetical protein